MKLKKQRVLKHIKAWWRKSTWNKVFAISMALIILWVASMYSIALWYQVSVRNQPIQLGTTFVPAYATSLGLNPEETMDALLDDLNIRHLRLVSYWNQLEPSNGTYDFSMLDWQFEKAEAAGATVSLAIGLRQPRYPECHMPEWAEKMPDGEWQPRLERFIEAVIKRYKKSPALASYQLENEFFLKVFGECPDFDRQRLINEYNLVKRLDPKHPVIISRSNNAIGTPIGEPVPDEYGISVYKRVWNANTKRYFEYAIPSWYYAFLSGVQKITKDRDMVLHELQAEAWPPEGKFVTAVSLEEQNKSIDANRLEKRFKYGVDTGIREIYLWGSEYWYYRMVKLDDPSLWNVAKEQFSRYD